MGSALLKHKILSDGQEICEWGARLSSEFSSGHLDTSVIYPMLSVSAATKKDWDVGSPYADMGHLQTAIWILDPNFRDTAQRLAFELLESGQCVVADDELAGLAISVGRRHTVVATESPNFVSREMGLRGDIKRAVFDFYREFGASAGGSSSNDLAKWIEQTTELHVAITDIPAEVDGARKYLCHFEGSAINFNVDTNSFDSSPAKSAAFVGWKDSPSLDAWCAALSAGRYAVFDGKEAGFIVLNIDHTNGAAFSDLGREKEIARIIAEAGAKFSAESNLREIDFTLEDANGNHVGRAFHAMDAEFETVSEGQVRLCICLASGALKSKEAGYIVGHVLNDAANDVRRGKLKSSLLDLSGEVVGRLACVEIKPEKSNSVNDCAEFSL